MFSYKTTLHLLFNLFFLALLSASSSSSPYCSVLLVVAAAPASAAVNEEKRAVVGSSVAPIRAPGGLRRVLQEPDDMMESVPVTTTTTTTTATTATATATATTRTTSSEDEDSTEPSIDDSRSNDEPSLASSDSSDDVSGRSGRVAAPSARECTSEQARDGEVEFECKASMEDATSEIKDKIKFKVGATKGDFLKIKVEYETEIEDIATDVERETETEYTLVYDRIIEYRKQGTAADNHFEWDSDMIVAQWPLDTWGTMSPLETDGNLLTFSATDGVATFIFTIAQTDSMDLTTNKMKIDFLLENYPWDAQGDTYVALISHIETERTTEVDGAIGDEEDQVTEVMIDFQEAVNTIGFVPFGDYSWATTAEATTFLNDVANGTDSGVDVAVGRQATIDGGDNNSTGLIGLNEATTETVSVIASRGPVNAGVVAYTEIAFSFVGGAQGADRIYWDPEAGVGYQASSSAAPVIGSMAVVAAASLALVVFGL